MLHRASQLVAAHLKRGQAFPRLADSATAESSSRLRELGQPPAGQRASNMPAPLRRVPNNDSPDLHLPERWDGLE